MSGPEIDPLLALQLEHAMRNDPLRWTCGECKREVGPMGGHGPGCTCKGYDGAPLITDEPTRWYLADGIQPDMVLRRKDGSGYVRGDGKPLTPEQEQSLIDIGEAVRTQDGLRPIEGTLAARLAAPFKAWCGTGTA